MKGLEIQGGMKDSPERKKRGRPHGVLICNKHRCYGSFTLSPCDKGATHFISYLLNVQFVPDAVPGSDESCTALPAGLTHFVLLWRVC